MRILALLFSVSLFAQSEVLVQLYNTGGVPAPQLKEATRIAGRVFAPAGITVRWQECPANCEEPGSGAVYILGLAGPQLEMPTPKALGFSMLATGERKPGRGVAAAGGGFCRGEQRPGRGGFGLLDRP